MKFMRGHALHPSCDLHGSQSNLPLSSSLSFLPLVRDKYWGRNEPKGPPNRPKNPLLCMALTAPSFLECTIEDVATSHSLYQIKTSGTTTIISRRESVSSWVITSSIKWPKIIPLKRSKARSELVLVHTEDGPWQGGDSLLKPGAKENSRKFRIPNHNSPVEWKLHDDLYWCTTQILGAIATLAPRRGNRPPKLTVYQDFRDEQCLHRASYGGVSILLLDYLVVTALLLVTDLQEWSLIPRPESSKLRHSQSEVGFRSATTPESWREKPMSRDRCDTSSESGSSMASKIRNGSLSENTPTTQTSLSSRRLHSWIDTDSDSEKEDDPRTMPRRRSALSPVSESLPSAVESGSSRLLHRPPSPTQGPPVSPTLQSRPTLEFHPGHNVVRSAFENRSTPPTPGFLSRSLSTRRVDPTNRFDGDVLLQRARSLRTAGVERDQNHINDQISMTNDFRPLPLLPTTCGPDQSAPETSGEPCALSPSSQHRMARILPPLPHDASAVVLSRLVDDPSSGAPQSQQPPRNTKADITKWLQRLTGDSSSSDHTTQPLLRASKFDAPPAYNSLGFPS